MKVRLMIIIGVISFLLGGCNKIQKNSNQVQLVQRQCHSVKHHFSGFLSIVAQLSRQKSEIFIMN